MRKDMLWACLKAGTQSEMTGVLSGFVRLHIEPVSHLRDCDFLEPLKVHIYKYIYIECVCKIYIYIYIKYNINIYIYIIL